ncbi:hypothetical protein RJT34_20240 [Clitoria ternatea]|uniref:Uncharacterized protein n=1 Tax=Clitoria ternatea TaxID=43366 RepID=A0AAN9P4Z5_CLITE
MELGKWRNLRVDIDPSCRLRQSKLRLTEDQEKIEEGHEKKGKLDLALYQQQSASTVVVHTQQVMLERLPLEKRRLRIGDAMPAAYGKETMPSYGEETLTD